MCFSALQPLTETFTRICRFRPILGSGKPGAPLWPLSKEGHTGRFAQYIRNFAMDRARKRPFRSILSSASDLLRRRKGRFARYCRRFWPLDASERPFRSILSSFSACRGMKKIASLDTVVIFNHGKHEKGRFTRNCRTFRL